MEIETPSEGNEKKSTFDKDFEFDCMSFGDFSVNDSTTTINHCALSITSLLEERTDLYEQIEM